MSSGHPGVSTSSTDVTPATRSERAILMRHSCPHIPSRPDANILRPEAARMTATLRSRPSSEARLDPQAASTKMNVITGTCPGVAEPWQRRRLRRSAAQGDAGAQVACLVDAGEDGAVGARIADGGGPRHRGRGAPDPNRVEDVWSVLRQTRPCRRDLKRVDGILAPCRFGPALERVSAGRASWTGRTDRRWRIEPIASRHRADRFRSTKSGLGRRRPLATQAPPAPAHAGRGTTWLDLGATARTSPLARRPGS